MPSCGRPRCSRPHPACPHRRRRRPLPRRLPPAAHASAASCRQGPRARARAEDPDIALEREKKLKEQKEQKERELEQQQQQQKKKELEAKQRAEDEAHRKKEQQQKLADQKKQQEPMPSRPKPRRPRLPPSRPPPTAPPRSSACRAWRVPAAADDSKGTALRSSGPSSGYAGRIAAAVRPNITFPDADTVNGNPSAEFEVNLAPDGTIVGVKLSKSSGLPGWDEAAERGLHKTDKLPRDTDGRIFPSLIVSLKPKR
jgi:colicin import membrane protein